LPGDEMIRKEFKIKDMECNMCVMRLEGIEDDLPGIRNITGSYQKQNLIIEYDEKLTSEEKIIEMIQKKGYSLQS
jgi:copper chaperone CopZ